MPSDSLRPSSVPAARTCQRRRSKPSVGRSALAKRRKNEGRPPGAREAVFQPEFREDLRHWVEHDRKVALRALQLIEAVLRDPIGKPEPLKHLLAGAWSRRLTEEHRLVYLVQGNRIDFLQ